jgi:amino acid transporter
MCLTGVDYFSTLGYQPSIAFEAAGILAPLATVVLVLLTLFGAVPVYAHVAGQSPHGQGSIAMLEHLVHGWKGKTLVLILLGFAATDFVITKTLSAADAAVHLIHNPFWQHMPDFVRQFGDEREQLFVTMFLLVMLGASFMRGFREVIGLAAVIVGVYLTLNAIVIGTCLWHLMTHPEKLQDWVHNLATGAWHIHHIPPWIHGTSIGAIIAICSETGAGLKWLRNWRGRDAFDSRQCR